MPKDQWWCGKINAKGYCMRYYTMDQDCVHIDPLLDDEEKLRLKLDAKRKH